MNDYRPQTDAELGYSCGIGMIEQLKRANRLADVVSDLLLMGVLDEPSWQVLAKELQRYHPSWPERLSCESQPRQAEEDPFSAPVQKAIAPAQGKNEQG